jgi:hypothetical protein
MIKYLFFLISTTAFAQTIPTLTDRIVYSSTNVGTSSWVQIFASTTYTVGNLCAADSSGQTMEIGVGSAGNEVRYLLLPAGGGCFPRSLNAGVRVSIRAVSATANSGELDMNLFP